MAASLFRNIIQNAKTVLTLNSKSFEYVNNITCKGVYIVPNFVDELLLHREYRVRKEIKEIVFVGYVRKSKGCIEIIAVAKQFPQLHFTLVGPVSEEIAVIEMPDNISLVGKNGAEEVMEYLHNADVFLLPSYTEGFSLSLTEAMSIGLPAIATDVGANADMLENKGGLIIKPKSVQAISDALRKLEKYSVRQNMSEWNVSKVYNSYTTDKVMEKIMSIYLGVNRTQN